MRSESFVHWFLRAIADQINGLPTDLEVAVKNGYLRTTWSPDRCTVVYVGDTAISLMLFKMTEVVEVVYVRGEYVPARNLSADQRRRLQGPDSWTSTKDLASGRVFPQAYCPSWRVDWVRRWQETKPEQFAAMVPGIVKEVEAAVPDLVAKLEVAEAQAVRDRLRWEEEDRRRREAERRAKEEAHRTDARNELLDAIAAWDESQRIEAYLDRARSAAEQLDAQQRQQLLDRIEHASALVRGVDPLELLVKWRTPHERG